MSSFSSNEKEILIVLEDNERFRQYVRAKLLENTHLMKDHTPARLKAVLKEGRLEGVDLDMLRELLQGVFACQSTTAFSVPCRSKDHRLLWYCVLAPLGLNTSRTVLNWKRGCDDHPPEFYQKAIRDHPACCPDCAIYGICGSRACRMRVVQIASAVTFSLAPLPRSTAQNKREQQRLTAGGEGGGGGDAQKPVGNKVDEKSLLQWAPPFYKSWSCHTHDGPSAACPFRLKLPESHHFFRYRANAFQNAPASDESSLISFWFDSL